MNRAMSVRASDRFASAEEMQAALDAWLSRGDATARLALAPDTERTVTAPNVTALLGSAPALRSPPAPLSVTLTSPVPAPLPSAASVNARARTPSQSKRAKRSRRTHRTRRSLLRDAGFAALLLLVALFGVSSTYYVMKVGVADARAADNLLR